jgi:hypothetical protein
MTDRDRDELQRTGILRLSGLVDAARLEAMQARVWEHLGRRGFVRDDPGSWPTGFLGGNQGMRQARLFDGFDTPAVAALLDELLGADRWGAETGWGQALITFPTPGPWAVPHKMWHIDLPGRGDPDRPGAARLFGLVDDIDPGGGATVVVEGSHELVRRMVAASEGHDAGGSSRLRRRLVARHPWFATLCSAELTDDDRRRICMDEGDEVDGVPVRVRELWGRAGDVWVMLPWTLHNLAPNASDRPRLAAAHSSYRAGSSPFVPTATSGSA